MSEISRKDLLAKNLGRMQKMFRKEYAFLPASFSLPGEANELRVCCRSNRCHQTEPSTKLSGVGLHWALSMAYLFQAFVKTKKGKKLTLIVKPHTGCQGKGIYLTSSCDNINMNENNVVQVRCDSPYIEAACAYLIHSFVGCARPTSATRC